LDTLVNDFFAWRLMGSRSMVMKMWFLVYYLLLAREAVVHILFR